MAVISYEEAARTQERESGLLFSLPYFEECFIHGEFDEAEEYLNGFTTVHDNIHSTTVVFELRWHKFLEALHENKQSEAQTIVYEELTTFVQYNEALIAQATQTMSIGYYGDPMDARRLAMVNLRRSLEANPLLRGKIRYRIPHHQGSDLSDLLLPPRPPPPPP